MCAWVKNAFFKIMSGIAPLIMIMTFYQKFYKVWQMTNHAFYVLTHKNYKVEVVNTASQKSLTYATDRR